MDFNKAFSNTHKILFCPLVGKSTLKYCRINSVCNIFLINKHFLLIVSSSAVVMVSSTKAVSVCVGGKGIKKQSPLKSTDLAPGFLLHEECRHTPWRWQHQTHPDGGLWFRPSCPQLKLSLKTLGELKEERKKVKRNVNCTEKKCHQAIIFTIGVVHLWSKVRTHKKVGQPWSEIKTAVSFCVLRQRKIVHQIIKPGKKKVEYLTKLFYWKMY